MRYTSDVNFQGRFQVKDVGTLGQLAEKGIGLQIDNLALTGESYGEARGTVDLSTTLTVNVPYKITITLYPATLYDTERVEFRVNNVLKGTITTANQVPNALGTAAAYVVASSLSTAAGGAAMIVTDINMTQIERG